MPPSPYSLLRRGWEAANRPLVDVPQPFDVDPNDPRVIAALKGVGNFGSDILEGMTSPLGAATTLLSLGTAGLARAGLSAAARRAAIAEAVLNAPQAAEGASEALQGVAERNAGRTLRGAVQGSLAGLGLRGGVPSASLRELAASTVAPALGGAIGNDGLTTGNERVDDALRMATSIGAGIAAPRMVRGRRSASVTPKPGKLALSDAKDVAREVAARAKLNASIARLLGGVKALPSTTERTLEDIRAGKRSALADDAQNEDATSGASTAYHRVSEVPERGGLFSPREFRASPFFDQLRETERVFRQGGLKEGQRGKAMREALIQAGVSPTQAAQVLALRDALPLPVVNGVDLDVRMRPSDVVIWDPDTNQFRFTNYGRGRMAAITDAAQEGGGATDWADIAPLVYLTGGDPTRVIQFARTMGAFSPGTKASYNPLQAAEIIARRELGQLGALSEEDLVARMQSGGMASMSPMYPVATAGRVRRAILGMPLESLKVEDLTGTTLDNPNSAALDLRNWGRIMGSMSEATPTDARYKLASEAQDEFYNAAGLPTNTGFARNWDYLQEVENNPSLSFNEVMQGLRLEPFYDQAGNFRRDYAESFLEQLPAMKQQLSELVKVKAQGAPVPRVWTAPEVSPDVKEAVLNMYLRQLAQAGWNKYVQDPAGRRRAANRLAKEQKGR